MSESTWDRAKRIFHEALERGSEERAAYLDETCAGDAGLRDEVERLLGSHAELLVSGSPTLPDDNGRPVAREGTSLGRYKLLQQIGEGGFGTVYMAEQQEPVRRKVALKVIKLGMDTKQVIARFEAERQALALMDHPNIARVLDAGATENGRPYFVMELVRGIPITDYCDQNKLTTRERLRLFLDVCSAVHHAHQKGIIHRDLKPSNVMVTLHDGRPVPKIIDFGIAKAMNQRLTEKTLFTAYEQFVGTPQYMSPEQAEMSGLDVDTRTDIYALGVILYELLTGTTPFDARKLREAGLDQIHRIIREEEPPRPSTRLSTLGEAATTTAGHHRTDVAGLQRELRGDLDWIVMKALEKDRTRRFETANSLRLDVERHLASEPVLARPPSLGYRLQIFLRRHRVGVAVASFIALALLAGIALALTGLVQARRERAVARAEADAAAGINAFFNEMLVSVEPQQNSRHSALAPLGQPAEVNGASLEREISVADMLLRNRAGIRESFAGKPVLEAVARETIGMGLLGFGLYEPATEELEAAWALRKAELGPDHPDTLRSQVQLGLAYADGNRAEEAEPILREAARLLAQLHGPEDARTLSARAVLAHALVNTRDHEEASATLEEVVEAQRRVLGDEHPDTVQSLLWWSHSLQWRNRGDEAALLTGEALETCRRTLPADDVLTLGALSDHGWSLFFMGRTDEGEELLREAVAGFTRLLGSDHPWTATAKMGLGRCLTRPEQMDEKERLWREAVESLRATQGEASHLLYIIRRDLAFFLLRRGKQEEGLRRLRTTVQAFRDHYGAAHSWTLDLHGNLVASLFSEGLVDEGLRELDRWRTAGAAAGADRLGARAWMELRAASALDRFGRPEEARVAGRAGLELRERIAEREGTPRAFEAAAWSWLTCDPAELRDPQRGLELATRALELLDEEREDLRAGILDTLARAQYDSGLVEEARATQGDVLRHPRAQLSSMRPEWVARLALYLSGPGGLDERRVLIDGEVAALREAEEPAWPQLRRLAEELGLRGVPAARVFDAALEECSRDPGCAELERAGLWNRKGLHLTWQERDSEALEAFDRSIQELEAVEASSGLAVVRLNRALPLLATGAAAEARAVAEAALAACREGEGDCLAEQRTLGTLLLRAGEPEAAEPLLAAAARGERSGAWSGEAWRIARSQSLWGEALSRLGRHAEAEPLLLAAHEVFRSERLQGPVAALRARSTRRITDLYESWGRPEALEAWRRRPGAAPASERAGH